MPRAVVVAAAAAGTSSSWRPVARNFAASAVPADVVDDPPPPPKSSDVKVVPEEKNQILELNLRPSDVVTELNKHIVGQDDAKRAVAIAMRNRWRRMQLPDDLKKEVTPRNVLLVGPTGCGKTEVARRMAMLNDAPFRTFFVVPPFFARRGILATAHATISHAHPLLLLLLLYFCKRLFPCWHCHPSHTRTQSRWKPPNLPRWGITAATWIKSFAI